MIENYITTYIISGQFVRILFIIGLIVCLIFILKGMYLLLLFFVPFTILTSSFRGVIIDFDQQTYVKYISILGWKSGEKKVLPKILYVVVKDTVFISENQEMGKSYDDCYEVSIMCEGRIKIELFYSYGENETRHFAKNLERKLNCETKDLTKGRLL